MLGRAQLLSLDCGICCTPHLTSICGTRPFFGGSGRRAVAHTRPAFPKNASGPVGIPLIRGASGAGWSTQPKGVIAWGEDALRPKEIIQLPRHTGQIRPAASTAGRSATRQLNQQNTAFPGLLHFILETYLIMLSVKQGGINYYFWVFGMIRPGIEPQSLGPLANTLRLSQW